MASSTKRIQTDDIHASNVASNTPSALSHTVTPDLTAALRNVGMRARKSVLEGYALNPNPQFGIASSSRAKSAGSLFQSSREDVQKNPQPKKRHRSVSPIAEDIDSHIDSDPMALDVKVHPERPVKPLKKAARAFSQSQSLPAGALFPSRGNTGDLRKLKEEEDDWSFDAGFQASSVTTPFEPMSLS